MLNFGLNKKNSLPLRRLLGIAGGNSNVSSKPLFFSASLKIDAGLSKCSLTLDMSDNHLLIMDGICLIIDGRWLHCLWIYCKLLFCFLYGLYFPVFKLSVYIWILCNMQISFCCDVQTAIFKNFTYPFFIFPTQVIVSVKSDILSTNFTF